jgi:hypothetical protein
LHQAIEKWLKLFIAVRRVEGVPTKGKNAHNLGLFLKATGKVEPKFLDLLKKIEAVDGNLLEHKFPGDLRYNETPSDIERHVETLMSAAFTTRRLVKRCLTGRPHAPDRV